MKNLFKKLFGGRAGLDPAGVSPTKNRTTAAVFRERIEASVTAEERNGHERALGISLGQEGIDPAAGDSPAVWLHALCAATDSQRAVAWLDTIKTEDALERIAATARLAEIRLMAAKRIGDMARIARLAQQMRDKDRGLYRHCQSLLKDQAGRTRRVEEIARLDQQFQALMAVPVPPAGKLYELRKHLAQLEDGPDLAGCRALLQQVAQREQEAAARARTIDGLTKEARALLATLKKAPAADPRQRGQAQAIAARLGEAIAERPDLGELATLMKQLETRLSALDEESRRAEQGPISPVEGAIPAAPSEAVVPAASEPATEEQAPFTGEHMTGASSADQPAHPAPQPAPRPARTPLDIDGIKQRLEQLEQAIEQGASQAAFRLSRELDQMAAALPHALAQRHRQLAGRLVQLRDWARWSSDQARDHLVEAAEALLSGPASVPHVAETVPRLREEWKCLDGFSRATREQWQRFDQALNHAYQPVLAERAERNARQDAIATAKASLMDEAEAWLAGLDREILKPGELQHRRNALRQHWRELPQAGPRDERRLQTRFRVLMDTIDTILQPFAAAETERRQRLTSAAKRLETETNLREAVHQAKALLQRWRDEATGIRLPHQLDESQWRAFREAIDAVFARRDAERQTHETRHHEETAARQALLDEFSQTLAGSPGTAQIEAAMAAFQERWEGPEQAEGEHDRKRRRDPLDHQAEALVDRARTQLREHHAARQRELLSLIARKAAWAEALETAAIAGEPGADAVWLQEEWRQAPHLPAEIEQKLAERFQRAPTVTAADLEAGLQVRSDLLIDLEILLDLPTPATDTGARQQRQLEWLQQGFQSFKQPAALLARALNWYATAARPDSTQTERMRRVHQVLAERLIEDAGH